MRASVVILTPFFRPVMGGAESNAERLAVYLQEQGFAVQVVTKRLAHALPDTDEYQGVAIHRIGPFGDRSAAAKWLLVPPVCAWLVRHAVANQVVCSVDCRGVGLAALAARQVTGCPVVFQPQTTGVLSAANLDPVLSHWHLPSNGPAARMMKGSLAMLYRQADAYACISRGIEHEAHDCHIPGDRIHYLPNAIDMQRFSPPTDAERTQLRQRLGLSEGMMACVFLGRLSREKGLMDLMQAWQRLRPSRAVLLVAGPDMPGHPWDEGPTARAFVTQHELGDSVRFLGPVTDVAPLLRASDLLVQPSHFEALGLSPIEALACGVPVVATAVGGLLDFVIEHVNGCLCPPYEPAALAECLQGVISDPALRRRLGQRARSSVEAEYDERVVFGRFARLLERLAGHRP